MSARHRPFVSLTGAGFCQRDRKCLCRDGHEGACWPSSEDGDDLFDMLTEAV